MNTSGHIVSHIRNYGSYAQHKQELLDLGFQFKYKDMASKLGSEVITSVVSVMCKTVP